eukprot:Blabericola_migrator_1__4663@NODE_2467_length_2718_cov_137_907205_g1544_i0_p1_GENE_NODE_2467_length_2718_cov_137_907205_g1544_i0NODE_2467_length_2718_cov_137_907205_g1544_i0_p1_ORF_typecomplete_len384_score97_54Glycolytic/PF00274_19/1_4e140VIGSSK/PF14773_6/0_28_NODE_2467_length_2718_cov_137_907205_g1544_i0801231
MVSLTLIHPHPIYPLCQPNSHTFTQAPKFSKEIMTELRQTATAICTPGKGILAADESTGTIQKRFDAIGVENTHENRIAYRELLFTAPDLNKYISGCILFEETLFDDAPSGPLVDLLKKQGIIPGIKVDKGLVDLPGSGGEKSTLGLDGLAERCIRYYERGARFAKWRTVLQIDTKKGWPSQQSIEDTAHSLARYAAICQQNKLVPIVEPEILVDGEHDIETSAEITEEVLSVVFRTLQIHHIFLEGCLLKPNMVTPGAKCSKRATPQEVAAYTVRTLNRTVPPALVGVTFLSGGQSEEEASQNLSAMNKNQKHPWTLTFSYGRALQASTQKAWAGKKENIKKAQEVLLERCKANSEAALGQYAGGAGGSDAAGGLFEEKYIY